MLPLQQEKAALPTEPRTRRSISSWENCTKAALGRAELAGGARWAFSRCSMPVRLPAGAIAARDSSPDAPRNLGPHRPPMGDDSAPRPC